VQVNIGSENLAGERFGRLLSGAATAGLSRVVGFSSIVIVTPLLVRYLGPERYGIWVTLSTAMTWLAILELGISPTLTNRVAAAFSQGRRDKAAEIFMTSFLLLGSVGATALVLFVALKQHICWERLFNVTNAALIPDLRLAVTVAVMVSLVGLPFGLVGRLLNGYQRVQTTNLVSIVSTTTALAGILGVVLFHGGLPELAFAQFGGVVFVNALTLVWISRNYFRAHGRLPEKFSVAQIRDMMREGGGFLILQLAGLMVFSTDNFVLSHYLGPDSVTPYSVTMRFTGYAAALQSLATSTIWATYAEAWARGDVRWIAKIYAQITRLTICVTGSACIAIAIFGRALIGYWAGMVARPPENLLIAMSIWTFIYAFSINQATVLGASGRIRIQIIASVITAFANLSLAILLVRRWGSVGVIAATITSYSVFILVPQSIALRSILRSDRQEGANK
jgi:O-antigen/teichoic acid export membrane protein